MELLNFILSELDLYRFVQSNAPTGDLQADMLWWDQYKILTDICEQNRKVLDDYNLKTAQRNLVDKGSKKKENELKTGSWWGDIEERDKQKAQDNPYYNLPKPTRAQFSRFKSQK